MKKTNHRSGDPRKRTQSCNTPKFKRENVNEKIDSLFKDYKKNAGFSFEEFVTFINKLRVFTSSKNSFDENIEIVRKSIERNGNEWSWVCVKVTEERMILAYTNGIVLNDIFTVPNVESSLYVINHYKELREDYLRKHGLSA